jgi:hypothetical protein
MPQPLLQNAEGVELNAEGVSPGFMLIFAKN